jgi:hypothetical protein
MKRGNIDWQIFIPSLYTTPGVRGEGQKQGIGALTKGNPRFSTPMGGLDGKGGNVAA